MRQNRETRGKKEIWNDGTRALLLTHQPALIDFYKKSMIKLGPVSGVWSHAPPPPPPNLHLCTKLQLLPQS